MTTQIEQKKFRVRYKIGCGISGCGLMRDTLEEAIKDGDEIYENYNSFVKVWVESDDGEIVVQ